MAEAFQMMVIVLAIVALVISFVVVYLMLKKQSKEKWPPVVPICPDWWKATKDSNGNVTCINVKNLGKCFTPFNPNASEYATNCNKYNWANNCGVQWDGITYGVPNPCS